MTVSFMSFIKMLNSRGLRRLPFGTPHRTVDQLERLSHPSVFEHLPSGSSRHLIAVFNICCIPIVMALPSKDFS